MTFPRLSRAQDIIEPQTEEDVGLLVQVSFDITTFTLPAYQQDTLHGSQQKTPTSCDVRVSLRAWQLPTLPPGGAVPSAMVSLTSLFGMGRGGSSPL